MEMKEKINQWFEETEHIEKLQNYIRDIDRSFLYLLPNRMVDFQQLLTTITKQEIEGKTVEEHVRLNFHYTVGELEEWNQFEQKVADFMLTLTNLTLRIKVQCVQQIEKFPPNALAHELHVFFIDAIMDTFEQECKALLHDFEKTKNMYGNEQLPLSVALVTKELQAEEKRTLQEQQAYFVGKTARLQKAIETASHLWRDAHSNSLHSLLNTMRMELYQYVSECIQKNADNLQKKN